MENLAFGPRAAKQAWVSLVLLAGGVAVYACGGDAEMDDADGLGGQGGSGIIVMPPSGGSNSGGTGGASTENKPPFETCSLPGQGTTPAGSMLIDDFDDGDAVLLGNGLRGTWYQYDDHREDMMNGTQTPSWEAANGWLPEAGGLESDGFALHVVGGGFTLWGSGQGMAFIWNDAINQECLFDASGFDGVSFWIKGEIDGSASTAAVEDRGVLKLGFQEEDILPLEVGGQCDPTDGQCYDWHKVRITPTACWQRYSLLFDEFEQDGWGLDGGELNLDKVLNFNLEISQGNTFDYWLDEVQFFSGDPPESEEICDDGVGGAGGEGGGGP